MIYMTCAILGFSTFGVLPAALELCAECTFPVSEGTSAGLMWLTVYVKNKHVLTNTLNFIYALQASHYNDPSGRHGQFKRYDGIIILRGMVLISFLCQAKRSITRHSITHCRSLRMLPATPICTMPSGSLLQPS